MNMKTDREQIEDARKRGLITPEQTKTLRAAIKPCRLTNEWREGPKEKRLGLLSMRCPACGTYGSHVGETVRG